MQPRPMRNRLWWSVELDLHCCGPQGLCSGKTKLLMLTSQATAILLANSLTKAQRISSPASIYWICFSGEEIGTRVATLTLVGLASLDLVIMLYSR